MLGKMTISVFSPFLNFDSIKLNSSIIYAASLLDNKLKDDFKNYIKTGKLVFSTPFPKNTLPKPLYPFKRNEIEELIEDNGNKNKIYKKFKKIKFVSKEAVDILIRKDNENSKRKYLEFVLNELDKSYTEERVIPKNKVSREDKETTIFYISEILPHNSQFDIYIHIDDDLKDEIENTLIKLITILGKIGVSKKRSIGYGRFSVVSEHIEKVEQPKSSFSLLLSKSFPDKNIIYGDLKISNIKFFKGKQFVKVPIVLEGSIVKSKFEGKIIEDYEDQYITSLKPVLYGDTNGDV